MVLSVVLPKFYTLWPSVADRLSNAGAAVLVSGVFASLLKSYQFSGVFQEELDRFFTNPGIIRKIREIAVFGKTGEDVLHKAMEHSVNLHCPELHSKFHDSANKLLRASNEYFHRGFERKITFLSYSSVTRKIRIRDDVSSTLVVCANTDFKSRHSGIGFNEVMTNIVLLELQKNGGDKKCMMDKAIFLDGAMSVQFPLETGVRYRFRRVIEQEYELHLDPVIHQQFVRFCDGLRVEIVNKVPDQIGFDVRFINFSEQIKPSVLRGDGDLAVEHTYTIDHLTFPFQGYIVVMNPIT